MPEIFYILLATIIVSLGSLIGVFTIPFRDERLSKSLLFLVSLSAGTLMGNAFLHILPEAFERFDGDAKPLFTLVLLSFMGFFLLEKALHWRHCHHGKCDVHSSFGYMNLFGDAVHNFIDGVIIAGTFLLDTRLGIFTTIAVSLHEIPQEVGDFGVLLYSGFGRRKALLMNFGIALTAVIGGIVGFFALSFVSGLINYLLPIAAGGFFYIAASDLMPEIIREPDLKRSRLSFVSFVFGVLIMYLLSTFLKV